MEYRINSETSSKSLVKLLRVLIKYKSYNVSIKMAKISYLQFTLFINTRWKTNFIHSCCEMQR